jgi:predicted PurR-regulated permease PerM
MADFLERIQSKPEGTRRRILMISTTLITFVIFLVWLGTFSVPSSVEENETNSETEKNYTFISDITKGFNEITDGIVGLFN